MTVLETELLKCLKGFINLTGQCSEFYKPDGTGITMQFVAWEDAAKRLIERAEAAQ